VAVALAVALGGIAAESALAQTKGTGRIVCWKDKAGKVVGCGDKVPPEYQDSATRETDRTGVTRKTTESAEEAAKQRALDQEASKQRAEEQKRAAEQKRQDTALVNTFSTEKEIDQKRDRDLQQMDIQMSQMMVSLKNSTDRYNEVKGRSDAAAKEKKAAPDALKDELAKATSDKQRIDQAITAKEREKEETRVRYGEQKKRWLELRGEASPAIPAGTTETRRVERAR
jgi:hypothetical protein